MDPLEQDIVNDMRMAKQNMEEAIRIYQTAQNRYYTYRMKICDNCRKIIPEGINYIEYDNGILIFCDEDCENCWNRC